MELSLLKDATPHCISCDKTIDESWDGQSPFDSPDDAVIFQDVGNYGSSIHDSLCSGIKWEIIVCDDCLIKKTRLVRQYTIVGYIEERNRKSAEIIQELKDSGELDRMIEEIKEKIKNDDKTKE